MAIYKGEATKDGRSWYFRVKVKGKGYNSKKYATKSEAKEEERIFLMKRDKPTHKEFVLVAKDYFKYVGKYKKVSTAHTLVRNYKKHILPFFQKDTLDSINTDRINEWKQFIKEKNYSSSYNNMLLTILSSILDYGVEYYELESNPVKKVKRFEIQRKPKEKIRYITYEEFNKFIDYVEDETYKAFYYTAFFTGCRKGELQALKWSDIDFNDRIIHINKTLYSKGLYNGENAIIQDTKNYINRKIQISKILYDVLKEYHDHIIKYKDYKKDWFVFGGTMYLPSTTIDRIKDKAFADSGVHRITMHEFRHSHVSLLVNEYIKNSKEKNVKVDTTKFFIMMSQRLGHSIEVMERTYLHLFPESQNEIVDLLDNLI